MSQAAPTREIEDEIIDLELEFLSVTDLDTRIETHAPVTACATWTSGI